MPESQGTFGFCSYIKVQRTLLGLVGGNFDSVHGGMFVIQSYCYLKEAVLWGSKHPINENGQAEAKGPAGRETVGGSYKAKF